MSTRAVVVTYDSGDYLGAFLDSLAASSVRPIPVTVVDNGSTDGAPQRAAARPEVTVVLNDANLGYGGGANAGVREARESWVLVANPDLVIRPGCVDALLAAADRWPTAGVLGPMIHTTDGMLYPSSRQIPSIGRGIGHAMLGWLWPSNPWTASYRRERGEPVEGPTGWLSGSCLLIRREAFDQVGGFDEGFFMYFEDLDLCERIAKAGWDIVYVPDAVVVHAGGHSTSSRRAAMAQAHHRSAYRYLARRYPGLRYLPLRMLLATGLWVRYRASRLFGRLSQGAIPTRRAPRPDSHP